MSEKLNPNDPFVLGLKFSDIDKRLRAIEAVVFPKVKVENKPASILGPEADRQIKEDLDNLTTF